MALAKRVIPTVLTKGRQMVKGRGFASDRVIGLALQAMQVHGGRAVDELVLLDVSATVEGRGPDLGLVQELSSSVFIPLTVGGGVRTLQDIDALLRAGADKVCIGAAAFDAPDLVRAAAMRFGSQAIVVSLDVLNGAVVYHNGTVPYPLSPCDTAEWFHGMGAGEILLQSVERDGTMQGYDLALIRQVSALVSIPVIASGGCGSAKHMEEAFAAGADACAAGAMFAFCDDTPKSVAQHLKKAGLEVRLP